MSEYQLYEFLALDQPLSAADMAYVRTLSSRVQPTPMQATFTYAYGDFPGDPLKLLVKHYDMMLYMANWGSKQLAFRFPKAALFCLPFDCALRPAQGSLRTNGSMVRYNHLCAVFPRSARKNRTPTEIKYRGS